jgi:outer membrane lipoprotein carrier protein LolA
VRLRALLALAACCVALQAGAAADWNVQVLFDMLAKHKPGRVSFEERKYLALLDRPVVSSGELAFIPPHTLEKRTVSPRPERVLVDRERVTLERAGKTRSMGLRENPAVAVLVESIRGTLAGDLASLTRTYSASLEGDAASWRLKLRPLDPSLATLVERIEIAGSQAEVRSVEIFQADGDRSVMSLAPAAR